eukprot:TRINITY_DN2993_c0_g2_i1.p1 TRINITY_DN2993_c0_g2~~TRINITY_DN2993_c0_g2_i1.p1  ORF type:complete len:417 (+),score=142.18 TRINITY_DN2993_c0_g2_i1:61-1311(+)
MLAAAVGTAALAALPAHYREREAAAAGRLAASGRVRSASDPSPPSLPDTFTAHTVETVVQGNATTVQHQFTSQDGAKRRTLVWYGTKMPMAPAEFVGTPKEWVNVTQYHLDNFFGFSLNGVDLIDQQASTPWSGQFVWVPASKYGGKVGGLDVWTEEAAGWTFEIRVNGTVPVWLRQTNPNFSGKSLNLTWEFSDFKAGDSYDGGWKNFSEDAFLHPAPCPPPANDSNVVKEMYIFHPANEFNISGQDLGDATGDVCFTCIDFLAGKPATIDHHYSWITLWEIEMYPQLGQYLNCNGYPPVCLGNGNSLVGHEAAEALAVPLGGQCTANPLTGEWYSLPPAGLCADGDAPSKGGCSWRVRRRVKTIDGKCLLAGTKYADACKADRRAPFPAATKLFLDAFASADPSKGGCPPLDGP